jgi:CRP-like cAMP-binding protein
MSTIEKIILLRTVEIFDGLPIQDLSNLAQISHEVEISHEEILFQAGDPADRVYVIAEGTVSVQVQDIEIMQFGPRTALGGLSFFDDLPHQATAVAMMPVRLLVLNRKDLGNLLTRQPYIAHNVMRAFARTVRRMRSNLVALGNRVRELEDLAGAALSPRYRAEKRGHDRLLEFHLTHRGEAAGQVIYTECAETLDQTELLRCSYDADMQIHTEYHCLMYRLEVSNWYSPQGLHAVRADLRLNLGRQQVSLMRDGDAFQLSLDRSGEKIEKRLACSDFDLTDLDVYFRLSDPWLPAEAGTSKPLRVFDLSESGAVVRQMLHFRGEETITVAGQEVPALAYRLEKENRSEDIWYHVGTGFPLAYLRDEGYVYEGSLARQSGYPELDFLTTNA